MGTTVLKFAGILSHPYQAYPDPKGGGGLKVLYKPAGSTVSRSYYVPPDFVETFRAEEKLINTILQSTELVRPSAGSSGPVAPFDPLPPLDPWVASQGPSQGNDWGPLALALLKLVIVAGVGGCALVAVVNAIKYAILGAVDAAIAVGSFVGSVLGYVAAIAILAYALLAIVGSGSGAVKTKQSGGGPTFNTYNNFYNN
jgi:hypothetical protein